MIDQDGGEHYDTPYGDEILGALLDARERLGVQLVRVAKNPDPVSCKQLAAYATGYHAASAELRAAVAERRYYDPDQLKGKHVNETA